jgi:nicotinamidase/pyrazinamidase
MGLNPDAALAVGDALIIVDVQNDFCPGGRLPISGGDAVIPVLNAWMACAHEKGVPIYASRDWHPHGHVSFVERGGPWPSHCVQDTDGAQFHPMLRLPPEAILVTKGVRFDKDQYSALDDTGLDEDLWARDVSRLWVGGLALDVCVLETARHARRSGFEVHVIAEGTRPITPEGGRDAIAALRAAGIVVEE